MSQATRLDGPAARATRLERPADDATATLPDELAARLRVERPFPTAGAEADVYLVRDAADQALRVLKLYRRGLKPKVAVLERVARSESRHLIRLHEHGSAGGLWYELMEYASYGSLRTLMDSPRDANATRALAVEVARELAAALGHLHAQSIVHRDVKPENVLVRQLEPLDLVLTDFGISSLIEAAQKFTGVARTVRYAAPEAASGAIGIPVDWWSLGMVLVELTCGRHPYEGLSEAVTMRQQMTLDVDVDAVGDTRLRRLCAGLLQRDPERRWGGAQVAKWLETEGADTVEMPVAAAEGEATAWRSAHRARAATPYVFREQRFAALQPLAEALASDWRAGLAEFSSGRLLAWVRDELREQSVATVLLDWQELDDAAQSHPAAMSPEERFHALLVAAGASLAALEGPASDDLLACAVHARRARRRDDVSLAWLKANLFASGTQATSADLAAYRKAIAVRVAQATAVFDGLATGVSFQVQDVAGLMPAMALAELGHATRPLTSLDSRAEIAAFDGRLGGRLAPLLDGHLPDWMREALWAHAKPLVLSAARQQRRGESAKIDRALLQPLRGLQTHLAGANPEDGLPERLAAALPKGNPRPASTAAKEVYALAASLRERTDQARQRWWASPVTWALAACWAGAIVGLWHIVRYEAQPEDFAISFAISCTLVTLLSALAAIGERRIRLRKAAQSRSRALGTALAQWIAELEREIA